MMNCINKKFKAILLASLLLVLAGCVPPETETPVSAQTQAPGGDSRLENTGWRLVSFGQPNAETPVIEGAELTLEFDSGVKAGGFGGCNTFGAEYQVVGEDQISINEIIATEIACEAEGVMQQEIAYFQALRSADRFEFSGDMLTIWYGEGGNALNFSRLTGSTPAPVTPSPDV